MIIYVNDRSGTTHKIDASSIMIENIIHVEETSNRTYQVIVPSFKQYTDLVEINFRISDSKKSLMDELAIENAKWLKDEEQL